MDQRQDFIDHSDEEVLQEHKQLEPTQMYDSMIFGFLIGLSIVHLANNGADILIFLPLTYLPIALRNARRRRVVRQVVRERNLG